MKKCLDKLREWNRKRSAEEEKKDNRRKALLKKFLFSGDMKKGDVFNKLKRNAHRQQLEELKNKLK